MPHGVLGSSPWTRAPLLLLRRPTVFLAIVAATAVLAVAASSGVLFLSTVGIASLRAQAADDCPEASMPSMEALVYSPHVAAANAAGAAAMRSAGARDAVYAVDLTRTQIQATQVTLYARAGALRHVHELTRTNGGPGSWFPDDFAAKLHARPGDVVTTATGAKIRVAGIYRNLSPDPFHLAGLPRYWCSWTDLIAQKLTEGGTPPLLISDVGTISAVRAQPSGQPPSPFVGVDVRWYDPIPLASATMRGARAAALSAARATTEYPLARALVHLERMTGGSVPSAVAAPVTLPGKLATAQRVHDGLRGSVLPIDLAAVLVALFLTAGAGVFWATHRSHEIELLRSRGVAPASFGAKAVLETLPAALIGMAAGIGGSFALVRTLGPAAQFEPGAPLQAGLAAGIAVLGGLLLIAAIGMRAGRDRVIGAPPRRTRHLPWEIILVGLAFWAWLRIRGSNGITVDHTIVHVDPVLLLFPLLGATGLLLLAGRLLTFAVPAAARIHRIGRAGYLALRRIGGSRAIAIGLVVGTALPCGLLAYASTLSEGVHTEITRKYQTNLGAPHVLQLIGVRFATPRLDGHGTAVVLYPNGATLPDGTSAEVLGLDPATFARFAFTTSGERHDIELLHTARDDRAATAILVQAKSATDPTSVDIGSTKLRIAVVARSELFPGLRSPDDPMLVVNRSTLGSVDPGVDRANEVWTNAGQLAAVSAVVRRAGYSVLGELDPALRLGNTGLLPLTWIFEYLRALAVLIGAVAVAGLVFALGARTRRRAVSYVMSRRMGLTQLTHIASLIVEVGIVIGVGWLLGTAVGLGGYVLVMGSLNLYPSLPPGASLALPGNALLVTAAVVLAMIVIAAVATHLVAERARPADILRLE